MFDVRSLYFRKRVQIKIFETFYIRQFKISHVYLFVGWFFGWLVYLFIYLYIYLFIYLFIYSFIYWKKEDSLHAECSMQIRANNRNGARGTKVVTLSFTLTRSSDNWRLYVTNRSPYLSIRTWWGNLVCRRGWHEMGIANLGEIRNILGEFCRIELVLAAVL